MPASEPVMLWYRTVRGKEFNIYFSSRARAKETLKILKQQKVVQTYNKGRCCRALITKVERCPLCKKVMTRDNPRNEIVPLLNCKPEKGLFHAHRNCCEKHKIPYRIYDIKDKQNPNKVIYPK